MAYKCYSVRLKELYRISDYAYKAVGHDGTEDIIPASQIFGRDYEVLKSDAYWISAWILEKKSITYSTKKVGWIKDGPKSPDGVARVSRPDGIISIQKHIPTKHEVRESNEITTLKSDKR